jgi:hypothetical protein
MRRHTAVVLLTVQLIATPAFYDYDFDRGFFSRARHAIQRVVHRMTTSNGDWIGPPKP